MKLSQKVKTALDEARMLILGAQILLGFQLRGAFSDAYPDLPVHARHLDGLGLILMVCATALLIAPGPYHRIVEGGEDSEELHRVVTLLADLALLPFALALGIDVFVIFERIGNTVIGIAGGVIASLVALGFWYALPWLAVGASERAMTQKQPNARQKTPLHAKIEQMLTEARMILPGAQALFGFQLAIVLTHAFEGLPDGSKIVHAVSIGLVALSVMLLMAPAAYHRIVFAGEDSPAMHRVGSILITAATLPLALGLAGDVYVVIGKIVGPHTGVWAGALSLVLLLALWYAFPLIAARLRRRTAAGQRYGNPSPAE